MSTNIGYSIDSKYFQCITFKKHSYDLQNEIIKNWSEEFIFLLFPVVALLVVAYTPVQAQDCADKAGVHTFMTSGMINDTVIISQIKSDSLAAAVSYSSESIPTIFTFLGKNINYLPKAIENKSQGI